MRRDLFVALALVSLTYVHGQPSDEPEKHDVNTELDPISKCLSEVKKEPKNFIDECHKLQKFKGPVCRGFMYINQEATWPLPYLTLCHLRALEHCTIFDGTIVIDLHRSNSLEDAGKTTNDDFEECLYDHLNNSFEIPARLMSHINNGGINVNHPGFKKELAKHKILKYTKNLVEITGALYVNHVQQLKYDDIEVESLGQLFPSLRIIRGNSYGYKQSLYVKKSYFRKIRLENLVAIVRNGVKLEGGGIGETNQLRTFNTGPSGTFKKLLLDKDAEVVTTTAISETANCQNPKDLSEVKNSKDYRFCYEKTGRDNKDSCWDEGPVFPESNATLQSYYCQIDVERVNVEAECNSLCLGGCKYNFVKPVPIDRFRFESSNNALPSLTPLQSFIENALTTAPEDAPLALDCAGCNWANSVSFIHESWRDEFASVCFSRKLHGKYCDADLEKPNSEGCDEPVTFYHGCPAEFPWRAGELVSDLDDLYPEGIHGWRCVTKQECYDLYKDKVDENSKTIFHCDDESCVSGSCQGPSITSLGTYRVYRCNELETDVQKMIHDTVVSIKAGQSDSNETPDLEPYRCNKGYSKKLSNKTDFICTKCYDKCETYVCDFCGKWDVNSGYEDQSATQSLGLEIFDEIGLKAIVGCEKIRTNGGMVIAIKDEKLIESVDGGISKVDKAFKSLREIDCLTIKGSDALTSLSFLNLTSVAGKTWNIEIEQNVNESKAIFSFTPCHFSSTKKRPHENGGSKIQKPSYPVKIQQNQSLQTLFAKNIEFTRSARVYIRIKEDNNGQTIKFSLGIKSSNLYMLNRTTGEETDISTRVSGISENDFLCPNEYLDLHMTKKIPNGKHISEWNNLIREYERKPEANKTLVLFLITENDLKKLYLDDMRTRHPQMTATTFEELYESQPPAVKKRYRNKSELLHKIFLRTRYWLHETFKSRHDNGHQAICDVFPLLNVTVVSTRDKTSDDSMTPTAVTDSNKQTFSAKYVHPMNNPVLTSSMGMTINEVVKFLKPEPFNKLCWDNSTGSLDSNYTPMCSKDPPASCPEETDSPEEPWKYKFNDVVMDDGPNLFYIKDKDARNYRAETRLSSSSCISSNTYNKIGNGNIPLSPCYSGKQWNPFSPEYKCDNEFTTSVTGDKSEGTRYEPCGEAVMKGLDDLHLEANMRYTAYLEAVINFGEDDRLDTNKKIILRSDHQNFKTEVDIANSVTFPTRLISSERTPDRNTTSLSVNYKMDVVTGKLKEFVIAYTRWTNNVGYCEDFEDLDSIMKKYEKVTMDEEFKMSFLKEVHQKCARPPQKKKDYSTFDQNSNDREFEKTVPKWKESFTEAGFFCRLNEKDISEDFDGNIDGWCDPKKIDHVEKPNIYVMPNDTVKPEEVDENNDHVASNDSNSEDIKEDDYEDYDYPDINWDTFTDDSDTTEPVTCNETCIFKRLSDFICDDLTRESLESRVKRDSLDSNDLDNELSCGKFFPYYAVDNSSSFTNISFVDRVDQIVNYTKILYPNSTRTIENQDQSDGFRLNLQKRLFLIGCAECFLKIEKAMFDVGLTYNYTTRVKPTEATTVTVSTETTEEFNEESPNSSQSSEEDSLSSDEDYSSPDSDDSPLDSPKDQRTRRKRQADLSSSESFSESDSGLPFNVSVETDQIQIPRVLKRTLDLNILRDIFDNVKIEKVLEESERAWTTPLEDLSTGKTVLLKVYACNEGTDCGASDFLKALGKCPVNDTNCEAQRNDVTLNLLNETFAKESLNWDDLNDQSDINRASAKTKFNTKPFKINDCPRGGCHEPDKTWVPGCLTEKSEWECNNVVDKKLELVFQAPDWREQNGYVILYEFEFTKEGGEPKSLTIQDHIARKNFAEKINETKFWDLFYAASKKNDMEEKLNFECLNEPSKAPEDWYTLTDTERLLEFAFKVIRGESRCYLCQEPKEEWPWCDPDFCGFRLLNLGGEEKSNILDRGEFEFQIRIYTTSTLFQRNEDFYTKDIDEKKFNAHFQITTFSGSNKIIVNMADKSVEIVLVSSLLTLCVIGGVALYRSRHKKPYMTMEWTVNPDCFEPDLAQRDAYYAAGGAAQTKAEFYINVDFLTPAEDMTYIGTGNYGDIYLAEYKEPEEEGRTHKVAVKFFKDVQDTKKIHKEREAFQTLGRTGGFFHITYYFGWSYISHPSIPMMSTCLVMEYMDCKSLNHYLRTYNPEKNTSGRRADESITVKRLLKMCADVADGMFFLNEELKFIHRDLAARNCLVARHETVNGEVYETVKISDFGLTRSMINDENKDYYCLDINDIPIRWWPPESIEGGKFMSLGDIWSYGVLLFEVVTLGCMPYVDISNAEVKAEIMRDIELKTHEFNVLSKKCWRDMISKSLLAVGIPAKEADDAYNNITKMIKICCHYEPTKRPTFRDLLEMIAQFDQLNGLQDFQDEYFFYKGRQDESYSVDSDCETESTTVTETQDVIKPLLNPNT